MRRGGKRSGSRLWEAERLESRAWRLDAVAVRLARARPAIDVALGEVLLRLGTGDRLTEINCSCKEDFAREDLGMSRSTFFNIEALALGLRTRPLLKKAVMAGEVTTVKALVVIRGTKESEEAPATLAAMEMTVAALKKRFRPGDDRPEYTSVRWSMAPEQQDRLDAAVALAKELEGYDAPEWRLLGRIGRDYLAGHDSDEPIEAAPPDDEPVGRSACEQLEACFEAQEMASSEVGAENALALKALALRLVQRRERFDEPLGRVLEAIARDELWKRLGYRDLGEYCRDRLGVSASTARERVRLEKRMRKLPPLRAALKSGRLNYTKAVEVARIATRATVEAEISAAEGTSCRRTKEKADAVERSRDREKGERRVHGQKESLERFEEAVEACRQKFALVGETITRGEARARVGEWFRARWSAEIRRREWRTKAEKAVLLRHGGLCAVATCSRAATDSHHIVFRSRGGPDDPWNRVGVCRVHHQRCIHRGFLTVRGRADERLVWVFKGLTKAGDLVPVAEWETLGRNEVRRRPPGHAA